MSISEYNVAATTDFRGPRLRLEQTDLPSDSALESVNMSYEDGSASTRFGFGEVWNPAEIVNTLFNWQKGGDAVSANGNYLFYYAPTSGKVRYLAGVTSPYTPVDLFTVAGGYGAVHAGAGTRLYTSIFNTSGEGHTECRVSSGFDSTGTVVTDKCFPAPLTSAATLSEPSAGLCTAGEKRVTYYLLSRSGHRGKLGGTATITCTGDKTIRFSLNATWPADALSIWAVMTTSSNLNRYIAVPGATTTVVGGATSTVNLDISISDDDLLATGKEVTDYSLWMTQSGGTGPFSPSHVFEIGSRMAYITKLNGVSEMYVSEPEQFQQITADQHVVRLPGEREIKTAFSMPSGAVYIVGPSWTYSTQDTGEKPALWPTPRVVDAQIGTLSPTGVDVNASRGFAWVADQGGLYLFADGQYSTKPVSYEVDSDWKRINWAYAHAVKVKDDKDRNRVLVSAPIDGGTAANAVFCFDYSGGVAPEKIRYTFWTIDNYFQSGMEIVYNPTTKRREVWLGSALASGSSILGKVLRQKNSADDASPYNDDGNGISYIYETAPFPPAPMGINAHHMIRMRVKGSGNVTLQVYRLDHSGTGAGPFTIALSTTPNNDLKKQFYISNTPAVTYRYTGNSANSYLQLSKIESYWKQFAGL